MVLSAGSRIGPYEIGALIGQGGMGEVYRAHDPRLDRDVAIKVLPAAFSDDPDRLRRFEQEARAAAALNHPNIVAIFDIVTDQSRPCVVTELLEGHTLRELIGGGGVPPRKALEYGVQIGNGLAAAHEKGIVHRDLKPENVFVTGDGRVKILDFGLAKLVEAVTAGVGAGATMMATRTVETTPGLVIGTVGYMSPEQVRGQPVDYRTDIFSFGAILYEMASGTRAFSGDSTADTLSAILKDDPPELTTPAGSVSPAVERVIRRCLEKNPAERFQSAKDLTFALEALSQSGPRSSQVAAILEAPRRRRPSKVVTVAVGAVAAVALLAAGYLAGSRRIPVAAQPSFEQLTFRRGAVHGARFAPDGKTIVYSAAWEGRPIQLFSTRSGSQESGTLDVPSANMLAISPSGEMAVALDGQLIGPWIVLGTLARVQLAGGAPRSLVENVESADWSRDGQLAVVRQAQPNFRVEYPIGTVLAEAPAWISNVRVAPDGRSVAFITHTFGDEGSVEVVGATKQRRTVSSGWKSIQGLAWAADGREIWFTAAKTGALRAIWAVPAAGGPERLVLRLPRRMTLEDVGADGRVLVTTDTFRSEIVVGDVNGGPARNVSWFDWATGLSLTKDGRMIQFTESGEGAGQRYGIYLRPTDGGPAVRLVDGNTSVIAPDGKQSLVVTDDNRLLVVPTGAGDTIAIPMGALSPLANIPAWMPDSQRFVLTAQENGHPTRIYVGSAKSRELRPLTPEGVGGRSVSPDGAWIVGRKTDRTAALFPIDGGAARPLPTYRADDSTIGWAPDGHSIIVRERGNGPARLTRIDIASGQRAPFTVLFPTDIAGVSGVGQIELTADLKQYAYNYFRVLGELVVITGLK